MATSPLPAKLAPPIAETPVDASTGAHTPVWTDFYQGVADQLAKLAVGVTDGGDAAPGNVGEYLTATASSVALTSNVAVNIVSLDLTAGDWDVAGNVQFATGAGQHSGFGAGLDGIDNYMPATFPTSALTVGVNAALQRYSLTATTTVWLQAFASFLGTATASGTIRARRVR